MLQLKPSPNPGKKAEYIHLEDKFVHAVIEITSENINELEQDCREILQKIERRKGSN